MELMKSVLLVLVISCETFHAFSELEVEMDLFEKMTEEVGLLLGNCKRLPVNNIAVLSDSNATIKWTSKSLERISLVNLKINDPWKPFSWDMTWHEKFHTFIIITSTEENLSYLIAGLKNSMLWNPTALYVLLDNRNLEHGCKALSFLKEAWEQDLLSSTYFCIDSTKGFVLYTYNPFSEWAPLSWKKVCNDNNNVRNHTGTLFVKKLIPGVTTCKDITFEKTMALNGYPLSILSVHLPPVLSVNMSKRGGDIFGGIDGNTLRDIWMKWNNTINATRYPGLTHSYPYVANMTSSEYDLLLGNHYLFNQRNVPMTYTHAYSGLCVLTRFQGYEDAYKKILKYMNPAFIIGVLLFSVATGIVLGNCTGQGKMRGCLEVLRIMLGVSMKHFPKANPLRIYLLTILILFMITSSIFQGNLSSLLTKPTLKAHVDTIEDLKESGYPIFMLNSYKNTIYDEILHSRSHALGNWNCTELVVNYENVACAGDKPLMLKVAIAKNLYISKERMNTLYTAYIVRPNWPLTDRLSRMLMMLKEGGLTIFWWRHTLAEYKNKWLKMEEDAKSRDYHTLVLRGVSFAFYILLFGHTVSIMVFFGEVLVYRSKKQKMRKKNVKNVILPYVH